MIVSFKKAQPGYSVVQQRLQDLRNTKKHLSLVYHDLRDSMIQGDKVDKKAFDSVVMNIRNVEEEMDKLYDHVSTKKNEWLQQGSQDMLSAVETSSAAKAFKTRVAASKQSVNSLGNIVLSKFEFIQKDHDEEPTAPEVVHTTPPKKITKKKDSKKLTTDQVTNVSQNIKELIAKKFRFKDNTECISKQRTKPYYSSKEEILSVIESSPELKKLMPTNYKKLTKDKLCEVFFANGAN